jgi:glycosyltransferase involved in cell wall biosynthesis
MSLPYNLPATLALYDLARDRPDLAFVLQHHDLYWEGPNAANFRTPHSGVADLIDRIICPDLPNARHVLISPIAQESLQGRRELTGVVIPDGFDFDRQPVLMDEGVFRERLELLVGSTRPVRADDLVVAMPGRIAINKAIELAIQFVAGLETRRVHLEDAPDGLGSNRRRFGKDSRIVLLLPQGKGLEENRGYFERLLAYARYRGITLAYAGDMVVADSQFQPGDMDHYPFYSTYQAADFVCYSAEHEGFGNQVIESIWAKQPLALFQYPVFKRYLRDHIPHFVSLGDAERLEWLPEYGGLHLLAEDVLDQALDGTIALLKDHGLADRFTEENAAVLRGFCGMDTVVDQYIALYNEAGMAVTPAPRAGVDAV